MEVEFVSLEDEEKRLRNALRAMKRHYDFCDHRLSAVFRPPLCGQRPRRGGQRNRPLSASISPSISTPTEHDPLGQGTAQSPLSLAGILLTMFDT